MYFRTNLVGTLGTAASRLSPAWSGAVRAVLEGRALAADRSPPDAAGLGAVSLTQ